MRRIVIAVILGALAGLTATDALAAGPPVRKPREPNCLLIARSPSSTSVSCRGILVRLAAQASAGEIAYGISLPYDEFGLAANQPSQPRIGPSVSSTRSAVTGLGTQAGDSAYGNTLPYDEFGLAANQPSQPRIGSVGPGN